MYALCEQSQPTFSNLSARHPRKTSPQRLSNIGGTKILKSMLVKFEQDAAANQNVASSALKVYTSINEARDYIAINSLFKLCALAQRPDTLGHELVWAEMSALPLA